MEPMLVTLKRGRGGIAGEYGDKRGHSISGYDSEFTRDWIDRCAEGCYVVDMQPLFEADNFASLVWGCPLTDVTLGDEEVDRLNVLDEGGVPSLVAATVAGNYFGAAGISALMHKGPEPGPFDNVSPAAWWRYWRDNGAKVGRILGGEIVWDAP